MNEDDRAGVNPWLVKANRDLEAARRMMVAANELSEYATAFRYPAD